jgi:glycosyltransferase involved in cell wall biosynthesis
MSGQLLGIVIPCFNEEGNLAEVISRCEGIVSTYPIEFLLVDNGSTDSTPDFLENLRPIPGISWIRIEKNIGYGFGISEGLRQLTQPWIGWIHADLQIDFNETIRFMMKLESSHPPKFLKGRRKNRKLGERLFTFLMSVYASVKLRTLISDANGQPTVMSRDLYERWTCIPNDFSIDVSALYLAKKEKVLIERLNIDFRKRYSGESKWNHGLKSRVQLSKRTYKYINQLSKAK